MCVFADCKYLDVLPKPEIEVIIKDDELVFETSYSIARDLTLSSNEVGAEITITKFDVRSLPHTPLKVEIESRTIEILHKGFVLPGWQLVN